MPLYSVAGVFRRIPMWVYIVLAALLVITSAVAVPRIITQRKINAELAAFRQAGWPVTLEELNASYKYPAGPNAATSLNNAFRLYDESNDDGVPLVSETILPAIGEPLAPEMKSKIVTYLAANAQALKLLHQGAATAGCRWPVGLRGGPEMMNQPHLASLRQGVRLLSLEAEVFADENNPDDAVSAIAASLDLARSLRTEPLLISQLTRYALDGMTFRELERVLSRVPFRTARLRELSSLAEEEEDPAAFERALAGDFCQWNLFFKASWDERKRLGMTENGGDYGRSPSTFIG